MSVVCCQTDYDSKLIPAQGSQKRSEMGVEEGLDLEAKEKPPGPKEASWVAELFPPHFKLFDLLEESGNRSRAGVQLPEPSSSFLLPTEKVTKVQCSRKLEMYRSALKEVRQTEDKKRREQLMEAVVRKPAESEEVSSRGTVERDVAFKQSPGQEYEKGCIWNEQDLACVWQAVCKVEHDKRSLSTQLQWALAEMERWRQKCSQLQEMLEERDMEMTHGRREAAMKNRQLAILQAQGEKNEACSKAWAKEARSKAQEARGVSEKLSKVEEELQELRATNVYLAQKVDMLRRQLEVEQHRKMIVALAEHETLVQGLRDEVEQARAELESERQNHACSRTALELLRRHYISQPEQLDQQQVDRITYM